MSMLPIKPVDAAEAGETADPPEDAGRNVGGPPATAEPVHPIHRAEIEPPPTFRGPAEIEAASCCMDAIAAAGGFPKSDVSEADFVRWFSALCALTIKALEAPKTLEDLPERGPSIN